MLRKVYMNTESVENVYMYQPSFIMLLVFRMLVEILSAHKLLISYSPLQHAVNFRLLLSFYLFYVLCKTMLV